MPARRKQYFGRQFDERRTKEAHGDKGLLLGKHVNLAMDAGSTHFDHLMAIGHASDKPLPIKFLHPKLKKKLHPRGKTYFGELLEQIQQILANYPDLRWWMEADGLVVDQVPPDLNLLSKFDRVAGPLVVQHWKDGLSASSLASIATKLDAEGFQLDKNLQGAQWKPISTYNQRHSRVAIKTFSAAVQRPQFNRSVRLRLYLSRNRYKKAFSRAEPIQ